MKEGPVLVLRRGLDVETRIALTEFRGGQYVDMRTWWKPPGDGEFRPTKKGVSIPVESLDQIIEALQEIERELEEDYSTSGAKGRSEVPG